MPKVDFYVAGNEVRSYFTTLSHCLTETAVTSASHDAIEMGQAISRVMELAYQAHAAGNKLIFVGNGGSAAIASHMATDYSKNGNVRSLALNDGSMLTCLGNDLGYSHAVNAARAAQCAVVTLSGFTPDNPLRGLGDINFYLASDRYGFVEIGHLTICHAVLDFICGLRVPYRVSPATAA